MAKKRIIILGAGLAGLSAAWHLQQKGIGCLVFEKEPEVGGLCRSTNINGFIFDRSGHLLHFKHKYTFDLVKGLLENNISRHKRSAWVYSHNRYIRYPFQANLYGLPPAVIKDCLLGFIYARKDNHRRNKKDINFLSWINQIFGKGIAKHFMIPYNTKFWTIAPKNLTCGWLDGFIPIPSLSQLLEGTIKEGREQLGYNAHFWYPKTGGISQLPKALASQIKNIHTNCPITEIDIAKKEIKISSGTKEKFDYLISTIPLPEIPQLIRALPREISVFFGKLKWNSILNLNLGIEKKDNTGQHWVYFPEAKFCFFRAGFPHNFSSSVSPNGKGAIYVEVAYSKDRPINNDKIAPQIKEDLKRAGILKNDSTLLCQNINDLNYGYPIYDKNYSLARRKIINFLSNYNIIPCGRYGSWRYMSMGDSLLNGRITAGFVRKIV